MKSFSARRRSGFTLIEMLIVVSVWAVVLGLIGVLLGRLLSADSHVRAASQEQADLMRLQRQFNADLRQATALEEPNEDVVRLAMPGGRWVVYRQNGSRLQRLQLEGDKINGREGYRLASGTKVRVDRLESDPGLLRLKIETAEGGAAVAAVSATIVVPLSADHRYSAMGDEGGAKQ